MGLPCRGGLNNILYRGCDVVKGVDWHVSDFDCEIIGVGWGPLSGYFPGLASVVGQ